MSAAIAEFAVIGLGKMGGNLALQALRKGMRVAGYTIGGASKELRDAGLVEAGELSGLRERLSAPRVVFLYIPAGKPVDDLIERLTSVLEANDVIGDGGNSYWGDSIRRHARLQQRGIQFVDLGTSGGVDGALNGACFMAGGDKSAIERIEPILRQLAVPEGYVYAGPAGAGHFTKLVHNGIEFGMLQAIGEGVALLENYREKLDVPEILRCWRHGSVIRSWLIDLLEASYRKEGEVEKIPSYVDDTGEVNWLVDDAMHMEVPVPVIAQSVMQLIASRDGRQIASRAIAMMRHGFGGHAYGPSPSAQQEREQGRVGGYLPRADAGR
jgi:6-phosphogluconate dehydrogenase